MKGDERVQTVEERADLALLGDISARNTNKLIKRTSFRRF